MCIAALCYELIYLFIYLFVYGSRAPVTWSSVYGAIVLLVRVSYHELDPDPAWFKLEFEYFFFQAIAVSRELVQQTQTRLLLSLSSSNIFLAIVSRASSPRTRHQTQTRLGLSLSSSNIFQVIVSRVSSLRTSQQAQLRKM